MSCSVFWKPLYNSGKYVGQGAFRDILERKYTFPAELSHSDIPYLEGIKNCGHGEAHVLIDAIDEYNVIKIFLEC